MDHQSSDSIIYMSPHNSKFDINKVKSASLIQDEADPPHFQNEFQRYQSAIRTPEKRNRNSVKRQLNISSNNKLLKHFPDPYGDYQNDMIAPNILSKEKELAQEVGCSLRNNTVKKAKKYEEILVSKLLASPKKQTAPPRIAKSSQELSIQDEYEEILQKIARNEPFTTPEVFFFSNEPDSSEGLTKLICFDLNQRNGRYVKFDHKAKTCIPVFKCYGCRKSFSVAAALGGHLSKCSQKNAHFQNSEKAVEVENSEDEGGYAMNSGEVKIEQGDSSEAKEKKQKVKKQAKRNTKLENYARTHRAKEPGRLDRSTHVRAAKLRASLLIQETIRGYL